MKAYISNQVATGRVNGRGGGRGSREVCHDEPGVTKMGHGERLNANQQAQRREKRRDKRIGGKLRRRHLDVDTKLEIAEGQDDG